MAYHGDHPHPFETATSPLYVSNDGRLRVEIERASLPAGYLVLDTRDGDVAIYTLDRTIADAYVAGYDLATRVDA